MTTYTWRGGTSDWQTAANWTPGDGPPSAADDDIAQADNPSTITGSGSANQFQTTNGSGLVTLDGDFNLGTIFNGDLMALQGSIASDFIETFVSLDITGTVSADGDLSDPDQGILQGNGAVVIEDGGSVNASSYTMNYIPGSLVPPPPNASSLLINGDAIGASLAITTVATVDTATNLIVGGFGILTAGTVEVINGGTLATTYLSIESSDATIDVDNSTLNVTQTSTDPDGVAGINIDGGTLDIENGGSLFATFLFQGGDDSSAFIVSGGKATISAPDDTINGIDEQDGGVYFTNDASVSASQVYLGPPLDPADTDGPFLGISASTLTITGTGTDPGLSFSGIWLADGATDIADASQVSTPMLEIDSPAVADPETDIGNDVTIESGSTVSVDNSVVMAVTDGAAVALTVTGTDTQLLWGDQLDVADGSGTGTGATAALFIEGGAAVIASDDPAATGLVAIGGAAGDNGYVQVAEDGSRLSAADAIVGDSGNGTLFATEGGTIDIAGTLDIGLNDGSTGTLEAAGIDGPGMIAVGTLDVGDYGDGTVLLSSGDGLNSGTLTVTGDAYVGLFGGGNGTIFAVGGSISIGGDFIVGDEGTALVDLASADLNVDGDLVIGDGGTAAYLGLTDVDLTLGGTLYVGEDGPGELDWGSTSDQATTLDTVVIGDMANGFGVFSLHDPTTILTVGTLLVGNEGTAALGIFNAATLEVTDSAAIGVEESGEGAILLQMGTSYYDEPYPNAGAAIVVDQTLYVGEAGVGALIVGLDDVDGDGASATINGDLVVAQEDTGFGTVEVTGDYVDQSGTTVASMITVGGNIYVGVSATGTIDFFGTFEPGGLLGVSNGATVDAIADGAGFVVVGQADGSSGEIDVDWGALNANTLAIGDDGDGALFINGGEVVVSGDIVAGDSADSSATIDIDDGGLLQADGSMIIGGGATAVVSGGTIEYPVVLEAHDGATVENTGTGDDAFVIGFDPGSLGEAIIDGSTLDVNAAIIGEDGSGVLAIINGGTATFNDDLTLGDGTAAFGGMDIEASDVDFYGTLVVGAGATGATINGTFVPGGLLTLEDGSTLFDQNFGGADIAADPGSTGQMIVDDSEADVSGIIIGDGGNGTLTVTNEGSLLVDPDQDVEIASAPGSTGTVTVDFNALLTFGSELDVGGGGDGILYVSNGGTVAPDIAADETTVYIGDDATATGTVTIDDSLFVTDDIIIGNAGTGTLIVQDGGTVDTAGDAVIGSEGSSVGTVDLIGLGGTIDDTLWTIAGQLQVGDLGHGTLDVNDGATLTVDGEFDVANEAEGSFGDNGVGYVNAFGSNSLIEANGALYVGGDGKGTIALAGNALLIADDAATFGDGINSSGTLFISGATFQSNGGDVTIGEQGVGFVQIAYGGDFNAGSSDVVLGDTDLGAGTLNLVPIGTGNDTAETGDLTVGEEGDGTLNVTGNGLVTTNGDAVIGDTGEGAVVINGVSATGTFDPATWSISGDLIIGGLLHGGGGVGTLTVSNNGIVQVAGEVVMWNQGTIIDNGATRGVIEVGGTTLTSGSGIVIDAATSAAAQGTLSGGGTIESDILDNGLVDLTNGQTLVIDGSITGAGTLLLDGTAVMRVNGAIASTVTIGFDSGAGQIDVLELDDPLAVAGTIFNIGSADGIDLLGVKFAGSSFNIVDNVLTVINGGSTVAALALGGTTYSSTAFSLAEDGSGNAEIVFENPVPPAAVPTLVMPAELPAFPLSYQEYLTGTAGIYVEDPDAPVNSTYTLTLNDKTGTMFVLYGIDTTQTDSAGSSPIKFIGSLAEIDADLNHVIYESGGSAFGHEAAPPDTLTVSLVRGDGVTVTGAAGYDPPVSNASIIYNGPTTVALGQAISLSFTPSDPIASSLGNNDFAASFNTASNSRNDAPFNGYLLALNQFASEGQATADYLNDEGAPLAAVAGDLGGGNLLFVPTATGIVPIDGSFFEDTGNGDVFSNQSATITVNVTVTAATRTSPVSDTWTAAAGVLSVAGNWNKGFAPGTIDTAVFRPIADVPVIKTTGDGVAATWNIDASTSFAGVVDATSGNALDIDQGATATFLDGSGLFAATLFNGNLDGQPIAAIRGNPIIVGDTAPSSLVASNADLVTGETTIGNDTGAGGSQMTLTNVFWAADGNAQTGNPGYVLVGNNGYGVLTLINSFVDNVEPQNYQAAGYGQIQIGQDNPGAAGSGGLGVFVNSTIKESVQVGYYGPGELAMSGGSIGNALNIQSVSLGVLGGRVDWGGGVTLWITSGLAGVDPASIEGGVVSGDDWTIDSQGFGTRLTNDGTLEAAAGAGGASSIIGVDASGTGTISIDAGATLDLAANSFASTIIGSGQTVVYAPEFNGAGGLLAITEPGDFGGTIAAFADGDRIAVPTGDTTAQVTSATYDAGSNTTLVDFAITEGGSISFGGDITFTGSLNVGNFALDPVAPAGFTVFDYVESGLSFQPLIISVPGTMTATDGVANPIPGLSLSDEDAARNHLTVSVTLTPVSAPAGTFTAPAAVGVTIGGDNTDTITISGGLAAVQAELAEIGFTPSAGSDEYIQVTASDGLSEASPVTFFALDSAGTENYIYTGPATGSFDNPGSWQDQTAGVYPTGPGIADSATIVSDPLTGGDDAIGGIGVAGQLLTEGLVVLTGSLTLGGLPLAGIGTVQGSGPAFAGALEAGAGNLILGSGAQLALGGDLIVTGTLDDIADNPWTVDGDVHVNGGTLLLGGLGALTVTGTVDVAGGEMDVLGDIDAPSGAAPILTSAAALIGIGAGTAVVNIGNVGFVQAWDVTGALVAGASGDADVTIGSSGVDAPSPAVTAATVTVGQSAGVTASLSVWAGSTLAVAATLTVGDAGAGTLAVTNGDVDTEGDSGGAVVVGSTTGPGELDIGAMAGGVGIVDISVDGAITVDGSAYLGGTSAGASGGTGTVTVADTSFFPSYGGLLDVTGGFTAYGGTISLRGGTLAIGALTIESGATLSGDGSVNGPGVSSGNLTNPSIINTAAPLTTIVDDGMIDANADPASGAAWLSLYGSVSGTGTLDIEAGATVDIQGAVASSLHVMFNGPGGELILSQPGSFAPVIDGFRSGDEIRMAGVAPGAVTYDTSTGLLTDTVGGTVYDFTFDPPSGSFAAVTDTHDGTLLELTAGPEITAPATLTLGVNQPGTIQGVSFAGTSTETGDNFTVTVSDISGILSATGAGVSGSGSKTLTITGSVPGINSALLTLSDTDAITPSDTITLSAIDNTQTVSASPQTIAVTVNGSPAIGAPSGVTVAQGTLTPVTGISLSESGDISNETFTVTVSDTYGLLSTSNAGAAIVNGTGTGLTISGALGDVNTALANLDDTDSTAAADTIELNASDSFGNTAGPVPIGVTVTASGPQLSGAIELSAATAGTPLPDTTEVASFTDTNLSDTAGDFDATISWGGGAPVTEATITGSNGSFTVAGGHTYDAPGDFPLNVTIVDTEDDAQLPLNGTVDVTDGNILTGQGITFSPNTGEPFSGAVANFTDADTITAASSFTATIDWGDGSSPTAGVVSGSDGSFSVSGDHTYTSTGDDPVTVTLNEVSPGTATATADSTADVVPQLAGAVTLTAATQDTPLPGTTEVASFTDTDLSDTSGTFSAEIDWGDGSPVEDGTVIGSDGSFTVEAGHTYTTPGDDTLGVTIADTANDAQLPLSGTVDVADGNSFVGQGVTLATTAGMTFSGTVATFTDTDTVTSASGLTATIDWGDGTAVTIGSVAGSDGAFTVSGTHDYTSPGVDTVTVTLSDNAPGTASATAASTADIGQTSILTKGVDVVSGGPGDNVIIAGSNTLSSGDQIDGGTGGANVLDLTTAGTFNLKLPTTLTDVQVVNAQEGQAAYSNASQSFTATNQIVTLRSGLNVTVEVSAATVNPLNPKPATITIIGGNDASVINLAGGNDVVTVGSAAETVHGGSGNDQIQVTANTIGATIDGGSGQSTLDVLGGGSAVMGASVTDISSVLLAATPGSMSFVANGISGLAVDDASAGADQVTAGGLDQTLTGGNGHDTFNGFSGGFTTFKDAAAAINGDTINNFLSSGDAIDITNLNPGAPGFEFNPVQNGASVTLNVTDGTHSAAMTLNGSFNVADFQVGPDAGSGTSITYQVSKP